MVHDSGLGRETYVPSSNVEVVRCHGTTVEALSFVALNVLVRLTRPAVARTDDRVASRPEFESDDVTRQGIDAVRCDKMLPLADFDRVNVYLAFCHGGRCVVDGTSCSIDHVVGL